ncbi:MAG: cell division protein FtsA [Bacteroidota bacterium]|jgi:cell division protein FtsA|nr:cell division protein FtsA [Bacteroidota bacterium]GDX48396.1 cell division protein FtsA [Bacteroidota bacterium]
MSTSEYIVGLDIGTTKICAMVGRKNEHGKIEIVSIGRAESLGVMRGTIANIDKTVDSIKKALQDAEDNSNIKIKNVYVGIAGQHIKSLQHRGIITRDNTDNEISRDDIKRLSDDMRRLVVNPGDRIIQVLPQEFIIDNEPGIKDPVGMCGVRLEANFHIITGQISAAQNIIKCVEKAGYKMIDMILEPLASADAVLSDEEKEAGVVLVDIGGGTTDVAIFQDGIIRHTHVIPFGGNIITEDIKDGCQVLRHVAEALKIHEGSAIASDDLDNKIVTIPGLRGKQQKEISVKNLAHIINARMEEIIADVEHEIHISGYRNKLIGGIVLTGGGSQLKNLVQLVQYMTGLDARIGYPTEHIVTPKIDEVKHPMYSTCIGLLMKGFEDYENKYEEYKRTNSSLQNNPPKTEESETVEPKTEKPKNKEKSKSSLSSFYQSILGFLNDDDVDDFNKKN